MPEVSLNNLIISIKDGKIASFPTDTVPALATLPDHCALIYQAKKRTLDKPLILMADTIASLDNYLLGSDHDRQIWQNIASKYWPGALTLVLPASELVPLTMNPQHPGTIGVRVPDSTIARSILAQTGPLATTSANFSGEPPLMTMRQINEQFPQVYTLAEEIPTLGSGIPSTVVKWTNNGWEILRQGAIEFIVQF